MTESRRQEERRNKVDRQLMATLRFEMTMGV